MRYIALLAVVLLSACSYFSRSDADFSCPKTGLVADASTIAFPTEDGKSTLVEATISGFSGSCSFKRMSSVEVDLMLPFITHRKEAGAPLKSIELPYFIAVLSPDEQILQRQRFSVKVDFDNTNISTNTEPHLLRIPVTAQKDAFKYKVAFGFVLTPEQLRYNKEHNK